MAGDQAYHSYFTIRAIQAYSEALELLIDSNADALTLAHMHEKLGDAYTQRANLDEAWQEYRRALQLVTAEPSVESELPAAPVRTTWRSWDRAGSGSSTVIPICRRHVPISTRA